MLNVIWLLLIVLAVIMGAINGTTTEVVTAVTDYAKIAFELALGLTGVMALWLGLMKVAEESGLVNLLSRLIRPIMSRLFPDVPVDHPAMGSMTLNIAANMLGLNNAATPLGLRAMDDLEKLNPTPGTATNAMCTFLAINTSSVQLIPATAIAYLAAGGSTHPTEIITTTLIATSFSTLAGIVSVKFLEKLPLFQVQPVEEEN
ncbi:MAG: nucleoside recognition protein [Gemmatimonadetes bacterium]|nr:MAG: nucleoside recognition protein [Gemmatimonadota bacterium]